MLTSIEICAGGGGQALGLEQAGFEHSELVELDRAACHTLRVNRPLWTVKQVDVKQYRFTGSSHINLFAGGVPCPPFSDAGKQLGEQDERDLFPHALRLVEEIQPDAVMLENVRGLMRPAFAAYRHAILARLNQAGYRSDWHVINSSDFGVPQLRPRSILVALREEIYRYYNPPFPRVEKKLTVAEAIGDLMHENGWLGYDAWRQKANTIAPTLVGGSKKHGGADLGPSRAKAKWLTLGINGKSLAEEAPDKKYIGNPRLTLKMVARLQGFPDEWQFTGRKTEAYRQIGNAFPPPVARAFGEAIQKAILAYYGAKQVVGKSKAAQLL